MLAAQQTFHMLPVACLMSPLFVVMPDLKLLSAFHCQMPPNVWVAMVAAAAEARSTSKGAEV